MALAANACLDDRLGKGGADRLGKALEVVDDRDQDIGNAARLDPRSRRALSSRAEWRSRLQGRQDAPA